MYPSSVVGKRQYTKVAVHNGRIDRVLVRLWMLNAQRLMFYPVIWNIFERLVFADGGEGVPHFSML
jgi:hypothetical protein